MALCKQERVEFVHETVVERGKVLQTLGTGFLQSLKEKHLRPRVELFEKFAELSHGIAPGGHT